MIGLISSHLNLEIHDLNKYLMESNNSIEILKSILGGFYKHYKYTEATKKFKKSVREIKYYKNSWDDIKRIIGKRELKEGEAFGLLSIEANLPLNKNTDEEAYKWLELMIRNVENKNDNDIIEY